MYYPECSWFISCYVQWADTALRPTMEPIRVVRKRIRSKVTGSLNTMMPTKTDPTAPIPVQTA